MKDNSGPAFPFIENDQLGQSVNLGMTKRELIAMHVMAEMMGAHDSDGNWTAQGCEREAAQSARMAADALIEELTSETK